MQTTDQSLNTVSLLVRISASPENPQNWNKFVHKFWPVIFGWCRDRNLSEHDSQDVTQNVLVGLFRSLKTHAYDEQLGPFRAWLFAITRNAIHTYFRKQKPFSQLFEDDQVMDELTNEIAANELIDIALQRVQKTANPDYWRVFELMHSTHCTPDEAATACNLRLDQVYRYKSQILKQLKLVIDELNG